MKDIIVYIIAATIAFLLLCQIINYLPPIKVHLV